MDEIWKDIYFVDNGEIIDYRGLYQVSGFGRVKSLARVDSRGHKRKEKILKTGKDKGRYEYVVLCKNGKLKTFKVHRLVAHMFINGYFEGAEVDHIDTNRINNHVDNLRWCSRKENCNNELSKKHYSEKIVSEEHRRKIGEASKGELVAQIDKNTDKILNLKYNSEYIEFDAGAISNCCRGKYKTHKGFIFKYLSDVPDDVINEYIIRTKQIPIK